MHDMHCPETGSIASPLSRAWSLALGALLATTIFPGIAFCECIDYHSYLQSVRRLHTPGTAQDIAVSGSYAVIGLRLLRNQMYVQAPAPRIASAVPAAPQSTPGPPATLEAPSPVTESQK